MKVCLVNPPFAFPSRAYFGLSHALGLRSLSAYLNTEGGHDVRLVDALLLGFAEVSPYSTGYLVGLGPADLVRRIPRDADLIGVSAPFSQLAPVVHDLVGAIKAALPHSTVVLGGVYPSTQPGLALTSEADLIVVGEGERALLALASGVDAGTIPGVISRDSPPAGRSGVAPIVDDLDTLPVPDYSVPCMERYFTLSPRGTPGPIASIVTSRGCPYDCEFCSIHPVYGRRYRARSAGLVVDEIEYLTRRFGVRRIEFEDDNLTWDLSRARAIFEGLVRLREAGTALEWRTPNGVRADALDEDLVRLMRLSGCTEIVFGLEHGDPSMLRLMGKTLDLDKLLEAVSWCRKHGIPKVTVFYMVGYPGETREQFETGLRFLERLKSAGSNVHVSPNFAQPYPGTRLLRRGWAEGWIDDPDYDNFLVRRDLMSTSTTIAITEAGVEPREVLRRRARVLRVFDRPVERAVKRIVPEPMLGLTRHARAAIRRARWEHRSVAQRLHGSAAEGGAVEGAGLARTCPDPPNRLR